MRSPQGAVFTRVELRQREQEQMDQLAQRMKMSSGAGTTTMTDTNNEGRHGNASSALIVGRSLLQQLQGEKAVGRLVINLPRIVRSPASSPCDVVLRDGDELLVPRFEQEVTVIGEVQDPTSHLFNPNLSRDDYIRVEWSVHGAGGQEKSIRGAHQWQRGRRRWQPLVRQSSNSAFDGDGRHHRRADKRGANAAAAILAGDHRNFVQRGHRCSGGARPIGI